MYDKKQYPQSHPNTDMYAEQTMPITDRKGIVFHSEWN